MLDSSSLPKAVILPPDIPPDFRAIILEHEPVGGLPVHHNGEVRAVIRGPPPPSAGPAAAGPPAVVSCASPQLTSESFVYRRYEP